MYDDLKLLAMLAGAGVVVGIAKMLVSEEKLTARLVVGRALLTGTCGLAAGAVLTFVPGLSTVALVGVACVLANLGASGVEALLKRMFK